MGLRIPKSEPLGSGKTLHTDNETTSPRIYVNRRTPSCMLMNFPDSDFQDRSASLRISNKSTAGARMQEQ